MNSKRDSFNPVTVWLAGDFRHANSRKMLAAGLEHMKSNSRSMRMALIYSDWNEVNRVIDAAIHSISNQQQLNGFLQKFLLQLENVDFLNQSDKLQISKSFALVSEEYQNAFHEWYQAVESPDSEVALLYRAFSSRVLQVSEDELAVVLNGKVYKVPNTEPFTVDDFALMEKYIINLVTDQVVEFLTEKELNSNSRKCSDLVMKLSAALLSKSQTRQRYDVSNVNEEHSVLSLEPRFSDQPAVELIAILDPLSRFLFFIFIQSPQFNI